jgi:hypothetical protein
LEEKQTTNQNQNPNVPPAKAILEGGYKITQTGSGKIRCRAVGCKPCDEGYTGKETCDKPKQKPVPKMERPEEEYKYPADSLIEAIKEMSGKGKKKRKHKKKKKHYYSD